MRFNRITRNGSFWEDRLSRTYLARLTFAVALYCALLVACKSQPQATVDPPAATIAAQPTSASATPGSTLGAPQPTQTEATPVQAAPTKTSKTSAPPVVPAPAPAASIAGIPDVDVHKTRGSKSAPVVMETFSDFQCPACKQLYIGTSRPLSDNYIATGKVFAIHRDFPLPGHAYSRVAARYGRAAAQLGKLEQVEQVLFENQEKWEQTGDVDGTVASVLSPADMTKIRAAIKNPGIDAAIEKDMALGRVYAVNQTPTTIIHYKGQTYPVVGIVSYDVLHQFLDQLLSQ